MADFISYIGEIILSIVGIGGIIIITLFLYFNEKKLKETKATQELKTMYRNAIYLSLFIIILGLLTYVWGIYTGSIGGDIGYFGWIIFSAGLCALFYSVIGYYNALSKKHKI